jgi:hypothetical protein
MHPALREGQATDWIDDLREFPAALVKEAVRRWRQSAESRRRPLPIDIRLICVERQRETAPANNRLPPPEAAPSRRWDDFTDEEKAAFNARVSEVKGVVGGVVKETVRRKAEMMEKP